MKWIKLVLRWLLRALGAVFAVALLWTGWHWGWRWYGRLPQQPGAAQIVDSDLWCFTDEVMAPCRARSLVHSPDGVRLIFMRNWETSLMITVVPVSDTEAAIDISYVCEKRRFRHFRGPMPRALYQQTIDRLVQQGFFTVERKQHWMRSTDAQEAVYLEVAKDGAFANWRAFIGKDLFGDEIMKLMELVHAIDFMRAWWERAAIEEMAHESSPVQPPPDLSR